MLRQDLQHLKAAEHVQSQHCGTAKRWESVIYNYLVILESVLIGVIFKIKLNVAADIPVS